MGGPRGRERGGRTYLIVLPVWFRRLTPGRIAAESAFCDHLRMLRDRLAPHFVRIVVVAPTMDEHDYERDRGMLGEIDEVADRIRFVAAHPWSVGTGRYWLRWLVPNILRIAGAVRRAAIVHSCCTHDVRRPFEFFAVLLAFLFRRECICMGDIDGRRDTEMNFATGRWSRRSYLVNRYLYDPLRRWQRRLAIRTCSLVLLKGERFAREEGRGQPHVRDFLDTAFGPEHVIPPAALGRKLAALRDASQPLQIVYFGRLTAYKGLSCCLDALARVRDAGITGWRLRVIGSGEEEADLRRRTSELRLDGFVEFEPPVPYGEELFARLRPMHLLLATPLSNDTPRNAIDAMASGMALLAFDTDYYADLERSGAVVTVPWPSVEHLAERIGAFARNKELLAPRCEAGVAFARANTAPAWVERRVRWTLELLGLEPAAPAIGSAASDGAEQLLESISAPLRPEPAAPGLLRSGDRLP